jgi:hypothetical protein
VCARLIETALPGAYRGESRRSIRGSLRIHTSGKTRNATGILAPARSSRGSFAVNILVESPAVPAVVMPGVPAAVLGRWDLRSLIEFVLQLPLESHEI